MTVPTDTLREELADAERALRNAAPTEVIDWALERFSGNVAMACSFEDLVLLDLALSRRADLELIFLDTGFHFPETLEFAHRVSEERGVNLTITTPGPEADAWPCGSERCCELRKVAPLQRALVGRDAWLTALKRVDAPTRAHVPVVSWDERFGLVKCNPIAAWTDDDIAWYLREHALPSHPLWAKGYASIGCAPVTRPVAPGESRRAGRWSGTDKEECGLHG
ncbi:MAG TPA: phosphoadenylyl-sulfate reductase [Acidimicrobiales bacterium]|nr:phosphoadenylyl-sulfate reductase [Acidimicrobiales bacterium]